MYAQVIVDISNDAVDRVFDYVALEDTQIGMRVSVPFANRTVLGYVIGLCEETSFDKTKIKSIIKKGLFWYYLEENNKPFFVEEEPGYFLRFINQKENNGYLFKVFYKNIPNTEC